MRIAPPVDAKVTTPVVLALPPPPPLKIWEEPGNAYALNDLYSMLSYKRPAHSKTERKFIREFIHPLGKDLKNDKYGNYYIRVGDAPVMWSSHTDTVHSCKGMLELGWDGDEVGVSEKDSANCLGADDTAGVWLMLQMLAAETPPPGLYLFHRAEEIGCLGSNFIADENRELLSGIKFAIALDRKDKTDVITHQRSMRCCSDEFAKSLAEQLGMGYRPDNGGVYTDTAVYTDFIGECTNISVGYRQAHSRYERLNLEHIFKLRDALLKIDWTKFVEKRKPGEIERKTYSYTGTTYFGGGEYGEFDYGANGHWVNGTFVRDVSKAGTNGYKPAGKSWWELQKEREDKDQIRRDKRGNVRKVSANTAFAMGHGKLPEGDAVSDDDDFEQCGASEFEQLAELCRLNPEPVASILETLGMGPKELAREILDICGIVRNK